MDGQWQLSEKRGYIERGCMTRCAIPHFHFFYPQVM